MPGRHLQPPSRRVGYRWLAGVLGLAIAGAAAGTALLVAGPAGAAATPKPTYHPGTDTATFAVTGVLDGNCAVSTGGTEVWIKPGDAINFNSSAVGINVPVLNGLLTQTIGKVVGLNVSATIDPGTSHAQKFSVVGGKTTAFPKAAQLSARDHVLTWKATSLAVLPVGLLGIGLGPLTNVRLYNSALKSGAALSWTGVIHVTKDAPKCKLSVGTPTIGVSVGPIGVTVPPINVTVPVPSLPKLPGLPKVPGAPGGGTTAPGGGQTTPPGGINYTPPGLTVPEQVMGGIGADGSGLLPDAGSSTQLGSGLPAVPVANGADPKSGSTSSSKSPSKSKQVDLASNKPPAAQLPVLLAIIAIIALSLVTATYARLYLLRRNI